MGGFWQTTPSGPEGRNRSASEALLPAILTLGRELEPDVAVPDAAVDGEGHGLVAQPGHLPFQLGGRQPLLPRLLGPPAVGVVEGLEGHLEPDALLAPLAEEGQHRVDLLTVGLGVALHLLGERREALLVPRDRPAHGPREDALLVLGLLEGEAH